MNHKAFAIIVFTFISIAFMILYREDLSSSGMTKRIFLWTYYRRFLRKVGRFSIGVMNLYLDPIS